MDDRSPWEPEDDEVKDPTEGVRVIGAREAAEALERGDVVARRPEGAARFGDRPDVPDEADVSLRFPLDEEPTASRSRSSSPAMPPWTEPATGQIPEVLSEAAPDDDLEVWSALATSGPRWRDQPSDWDDAHDDIDVRHDDATRVGALDESDRPAPDDFFAPIDDDVPARTARTRRPAARTGARAGAGAAGAVGAAGAGAAAGAGVRPRQRGARPSGGGRAGARGPGRGGSALGSGGGRSRGDERDIQLATLTGLALGVATLAVLVFLPIWAMVVVLTCVVAVASLELYAALQRGGYQPATLLGLVAAASLPLGAYYRDLEALPLILALAVVCSMLWFMLGVTRLQPVLNIGVTVFGVAYVGLLGSFAALMLRFPNGKGVIAGVVLVTVANDVGALLIGRSLGRAPFAASISPNKTIEGLIGGALASVFVSWLVLDVIGLAPWGTKSALLLGLVVAVAAPLGDLCESMLKRDLDVKDLSTTLPGHGGLLDRFDALLFVLPAAYYLCRLLEVF